MMETKPLVSDQQTLIPRHGLGSKASFDQGKGSVLLYFVIILTLDNIIYYFFISNYVYSEAMPRYQALLDRNRRFWIYRTL